MAYKKELLKVKNLNGTRDKEPSGYDSWIEYWESNVEYKANKCSRCGCNNCKDLVGAHVKKVYGEDYKHYIVPLCKGCNNLDDEFIVFSEFVPANKNNL